MYKGCQDNLKQFSELLFGPFCLDFFEVNFPFSSSFSQGIGCLVRTMSKTSSIHLTGFISNSDLMLSGISF